MSSGRSSAIMPICTIMIISFKSLLKLWNVESGNDSEFSFRYKHALCPSSSTVFIELSYLNISKSFISLLLCVEALQILQWNYCRAANKAVGALSLPSCTCSHTCRSHFPCATSTTGYQSMFQTGREQTWLSWKPPRIIKVYFCRGVPEPAHPAAPQTQTCSEAEHAHWSVPHSSSSLVLWYVTASL